MVDVSNDNRGMTDLYLLFKRREDIHSYLVHEIKPVGRLRACDHIDYTTGFIEHNGVSHIDTHKLTIKTNANLDFTNNDYLYDVKYRITWKIDTFSTADDGQMKEYSMRPRKTTFINLVR